MKACKSCGLEECYHYMTVSGVFEFCLRCAQWYWGEMFVLRPRTPKRQNTDYDYLYKERDKGSATTVERRAF